MSLSPLLDPWLAHPGQERFAVHDAATGVWLADVPENHVNEALAAIEAAKAAQVDWAALTPRERGAILRRWSELLLKHQDELAYLLTREQGKPLAEARGEIAFAASFFEWFAEEGRRVYGEVIPSPSSARRLLTVRQPVGVAAAITPWNFPVSMLARKAAAALAAGCAIVIKPAEQTPLSALAQQSIAHEAGLPPDLFRIVTASRASASEIGEVFCHSPDIGVLSFTGSTRVGKLLLQQSSASVKRLALELGGNAPFIVFDDANLDEAVTAAIQSKFRNAGQTCVSANRILVHNTIFEAFVQRFVAQVERLKVGNGLESSIHIGPLIDKRAVEKVGRLIEEAIARGGAVLTGGKIHALGGSFFEPTVISGVRADMRIFREEIFGPVAPLTVFQDETEAIALANDSEAGLAAYVFTNTVSRAIRVSEALHYGMVGINEIAISTAEAPFGGVRQSGLGREGARAGIEEYLDIKLLCLGGL